MMAMNNKYVGAPYNFVPFTDADFSPVSDEDMNVRGELNDDLLTGEISFTLVSKTPVIVDSGKGEFFVNEYGRISIPASSIRGLIRSNVQILSGSSVKADIDDYRLMYRNVAFGPNKNRYNKDLLGAKQINLNGKSLSVLSNVQAGYISKVGSGYVIYKTNVDMIQKELGAMNYYVLSERTICKNREDYPIINTHSEYFQHVLEKGFKRVEKEINMKGKKMVRAHYIGTKNPQYKPGYYPISYEVIRNRVITKLGEPGQFSHEGYMVCTGPMNEKKSFYIIPQIDKSKEAIVLDKKDIETFNIDFNKKLNVLMPLFNKDESAARHYYGLPREGEIKPVFYIDLDDVNNGRKKTYFGYTPRLRVFYDYSVKDGYRQAGSEDAFDYTKSMFGTTEGDIAYKSKLSFTDVDVKEYEKNKSAKIILAEPKTSSYLDYIEQDGENTTTYNTEGFKLRGIKQYWLRDHILDGETNTKNKDVGSEINAISDATFCGKVRFRNLTKNELGLLLWAIRLEKNSCMNIGKGKPYGYGAVKVTELSAKTINNKSAYDLEDSISFNPFENVDIDEYIESYKNNTIIGGTKVSQLPSVQTFMLMKNYDNLPEEKEIRYMSVDAGEYQSRREALKSVEEVLKEKGTNESNSYDMSISEGVTGTIKKLIDSDGKRFGFISSNGQDYYFNVYDVDGDFGLLAQGQKVSFAKRKDKSGRDAAKNVRGL